MSSSDLPKLSRTSVKPVQCTSGCHTFATKIYWLIQFLEYAETANRAESGQLQFWSEPSEILNLRSSNTPETVSVIIYWYLEVYKYVNFGSSDDNMVQLNKYETATYIFQSNQNLTCDFLLIFVFLPIFD